MDTIINYQTIKAILDSIKEVLDKISTAKIYITLGLIIYVIKMKYDHKNAITQNEKNNVEFTHQILFGQNYGILYIITQLWLITIKIYLVKLILTKLSGLI